MFSPISEQSEAKMSLVDFAFLKSTPSEQLLTRSCQIFFSWNELEQSGITLRDKFAVWIKIACILRYVHLLEENAITLWPIILG